MVDEVRVVCILKGSVDLGSSHGGVGLGCGVGQDWNDVKWLVMIWFIVSGWSCRRRVFGSLRAGCAVFCGSFLNMILWAILGLM